MVWNAVTAAAAGTKAAAAMSPAERSASASRAASARWARFRAERLAAGELPPGTDPGARRAPSRWGQQVPPPAEALEPYLEAVDQQWPGLTYDQRRRQATALLRADIAQAVAVAATPTSEDSTP